MLEVCNLLRRFPGQTKPALAGVSFSVQKNDTLVITGANGSGKSVLMNLLANLDTPTSGSVTRAKARIGLVFQDADAQILGDTPEEDAAFGPRNLGKSRKEAAVIGRSALARTGLSGKEQMPARSLSGGEKRRLAVAGILAMDAEIIIFDEPFANLDWPGVLQVTSIIEQLKNEGKTLIILTHELEKILALANRLMVLFEGNLVYDGTPADALENAPLGSWGIRNPIGAYQGLSDLIWSTP